MQSRPRIALAALLLLAGVSALPVSSATLPAINKCAPPPDLPVTVDPGWACFLMPPLPEPGETPIHYAERVALYYICMDASQVPPGVTVSDQCGPLDFLFAIAQALPL
jgi:hypothetical protein